MSSLAEILRSRTWERPSVPGVPVNTFAHEEPKEDTKNKTTLGSYGTSSSPGTPGTDSSIDVAQPTGTPYWPLHLPRLFLDIETYYDPAYNLEKLDYIEYTFDSRFRAHGIAVAHPDGRAEFHTDIEALVRDLRSAYGGRLERVAVVCHNAAFDLFVLRHRYGLEVAYPCDTMLISRLLHGAEAGHGLKELAGRYGLPPKGDLDFMKGVKAPTTGQMADLSNYAVNDVRITAALAEQMWPYAAPRPIELWAMAHSLRMFVERPLPVNAEVVTSTAGQLEQDIRERVAATGLDEKSIRSTKRFPGILGAALARTGRSLPMKPGARGPIPAIAKDDPAGPALLADADPEVRALMEAKVALSSAAGSRGRLEHLQRGAHFMGGRCAFLHNFHNTGTGRFTGGNGCNIQNLKKVDGEGGIAAGIRRAIHAPPGMYLVAADASQIEARILAYAAGQFDLHHSFANGEDVYSSFASRHLGMEVRKPTPADLPEKAASLNVLRQIGKQAVLGLGYGMGVRGFIESLKSKPALAHLIASGILNASTCARIVYGYRDQYPHVHAAWGYGETAILQAVHGVPAEALGCRFEVHQRTLYITLPSGRRLVYPDVRIKQPTYGQVEYIDRDGITQQMQSCDARVVYGDDNYLYGGLIVENIVQAIARDLLVDVMYRVESEGLPVVLHCHDSVTTCVREDDVAHAEQVLIHAWRKVPAWASGLVLNAEAKHGTTLADL